MLHVNYNGCLIAPSIFIKPVNTKSIGIVSLVHLRHSSTIKIKKNPSLIDTRLAALAHKVAELAKVINKRMRYFIGYGIHSENHFNY